MLICIFGSLIASSKPLTHNPAGGHLVMANISSYQYGKVTIECQQRDIARQEDMDAVVNAANAQLMPGGGVAGAIHRAAGRGLAEECKPLAPIEPGEAVITGAHNLPNKHVIHCLGPVYGQDRPEDELLDACYRNALRLAEENNLKSIAFPSISTGAFGYPVEPAAHVAMGAVRDFDGYRSLRTVRFVLFSKKDLGVYCEALELVFQPAGK